MKLSFASSFQKFVFGVALAGCILGAAPAFATVVYNLNPNNVEGPVGSSTISYTQQDSSTSQSYTITATGYDNNNGVGSLHSLYFKNQQDIGEAREVGLGLTGTSHNELQAGSSVGNPFDFIQFDLTMLVRAGATNGTVTVASLQAKESFTIFGSNTAGVLGMQIGGGTKDNTPVAFQLFPQFNFYSIAAAKGDVLPSQLTVDVPAVPEMSALLPIVALLGFIGVAESTRRRRLRA